MYTLPSGPAEANAMVATSFGIRVVHPLAILSPSSHRRVSSCRLHRHPPLLAHRCARVCAFSGPVDSDDEDSRVSSAPSSGLSVDELEQRLGRRRRSRKGKPDTADRKPPPKDWESMTFAEKAWDLYVGEKGTLFWLNKIAYAAIFVIVGGWILFRFAGPALNLYQLENTLLPPTEVFSGTK